VQLDVRLDEIVLRALEKDPARRYAAASDFKTQIETVAASGSTYSSSSSTPKNRFQRIASSHWFRFLPVVLMLVILISTINRNATSSSKHTAQTAVSEKKSVSPTTESPPAPDSIILLNFDASKANEPPRLRAINWLDKAQANPASSWLPTGEPVPSTKTLPPVPGMKDPITPNIRFLCLWFSHPLFDKQSHVKLTILDHTGAPLSSPRKALHRQTQSMAAHNSRSEGWISEGWIIPTLSLHNFGDSPNPVIVRLDYSLGAWTYTREMPVTPHAMQTTVLNDGTVIGSPAQDAAGKAFIETSFNPKSVSQVEQLDFVAVTHNGRRLNRTSQTSQGYEDLLTKRFVFDVPLAEVRAFAIRTRPILTTEWTVPLQRTNPAPSNMAIKP
jgi:hypothetical protein